VVPCGVLRWQTISVLVHVKLSYRRKVLDVIFCLQSLDGSSISRLPNPTTLSVLISVASWQQTVSSLIYVFTWRRSWSFAEYCKNFVARLNGVWTMFTRSAITQPEVNGFGWNLGNSEYIAWSCPDKFWALSVQKRQQKREPNFFLSIKQRAILPTSGRPNFTKFAQNDVFSCPHVGLWKRLWKFARKGSLSQKNLHFCLIKVNDFRLPAAISPKWLQILESHDRLARLWNVGFPLTPLEWTQIDSPGL